MASPQEQSETGILNGIMTPGVESVETEPVTMEHDRGLLEDTLACIGASATADQSQQIVRGSDVNEHNAPPHVHGHHKYPQPNKGAFHARFRSWH